jgi:hypothetical protein
MGVNQSELWNDLFIAIDTNENGVLSRKEVKAAFTGIWDGENNKKEGKRGDFEALLDAVMKADANKDGTTTKEEWKAAFTIIAGPKANTMSKALITAAKMIVMTAYAEKTAVWLISEAEGKTGACIHQGGNSLFESSGGKVVQFGPNETAWTFHAVEKDGKISVGDEIDAKNLSGKTVFVRAADGGSKGKYLSADPKIKLTMKAEPKTWEKFTFLAGKAGGYKIRTDHNRFLNLSKFNKTVGYHEVKKSSDAVLPTHEFTWTHFE